MGGFVVHQEAKWLVFITLMFHPIDSQVGNDIGNIAWPLQLLSVAKKIGIVVIALVNKNIPVVKSCRQ